MVTVAEKNPIPISRGVVIGSLADSKRQVITIHADGSISGLIHKPGSGLSLIDMGHASVERASIIEWDDSQQWCIKFLAGPQADTFMTWAELIQAYPHLKDSPPYKEIMDNAGLHQIVGFRTYELAVEAEIAYFNAQRLAGNMSDTDKTI